MVVDLDLVVLLVFFLVLREIVDVQPDRKPRQERLRVVVEHRVDRLVFIQRPFYLAITRTASDRTTP